MRTYVTFLLLFMSAFIISCQFGEESKEVQKELTWYTTTGYSPQSNTPAAAEIKWLQVVEAENDYAEIKMKIEIQSMTIPEAMAKLLEQANGGNALDVVAIDSYLFPQYIDYLEPLGDLIRDE